MPGLVREEDDMPLGGNGKHDKFWAGYDSATTGEILTTVAKNGTEEFRKEVIEKEKKGKKRDSIIVPLVNWNS